MNDDTVPIRELAESLGLTEKTYRPYGYDKAKVELSLLDAEPRGRGRLILVSAINPTPAGEGKTTMSIALAMGMRRQGKDVMLALREPSLGPVFGVKGGGTGGGKACLVPAADINLHFTGDLHAITAAHNTLSAIVDNTAYHGDVFGERGRLDPRLISFPRVLDVNDRFLRHCIVGLGGKSHGIPRETRFDITAASEVMATLALASDRDDLAARLGRIVVGMSDGGHAISAEDVGAKGAMVALLRDALLPNLVQTREGGPALVHCGPFANIAHGCSSVVATRMAMRLSDYVVTEAGFGLDLGGEKFLDIKCRNAGVWPRAVVLVVTLRALRMHGGASVKDAGVSAPGRVEEGLLHVEKHYETLRHFGLPTVVAINQFPTDTEEELLLVDAHAQKFGVRVARCEGFAKGGEGSLDLARVVTEVVDTTDASPPEPRYAYELGDSAVDKMRKIAQTVYGARDVVLEASAQRDLAQITKIGASDLPICMAKTQLSLTDDPKRPGRPTNFDIHVREVRLSRGAGFLVAVTGDLMTMPGLPKVPAGRAVRVEPDGRILGLMQNEV